MHSFSREAAASYAEQQVQQKRVERVRAVREEAARRSKMQASQFQEIRAATRQEMKEAMEESWRENKEQKIQQLRAHYDRMQAAAGSGHLSAHQNTEQMHRTVLAQQTQWEQQRAVQSERGRKSMSILQRRMLEEQTARETRAEWRTKAMALALEYRRKLQRRLQHQYFILPEGLCPQQPFSQHPPREIERIKLVFNALNVNAHSDSRCSTDPRFSESHRYTLIAATDSQHHRRPSPSASHDALTELPAPSISGFNPHPLLYFQAVSTPQSRQSVPSPVPPPRPTVTAPASAVDESSTPKVVPNLKAYLPRGMMRRLNRKYRKKSKKRKKKRAAFNGVAMRSIPEEVEEQSFHAVPSHIQRERERLSLSAAAAQSATPKPTATPWERADQIRAATAEKQRVNAQLFVTAQQRGKRAMEQQNKQTLSKQTEEAMDSLHQQMITDKLRKCQQILDKSKQSRSTNTALQAELEEKFERLFRAHAQSKGKENEPPTKKGTNQRRAEREEMRPRVQAPSPVVRAAADTLSNTPSPRKPTGQRLEAQRERTQSIEISTTSSPPPPNMQPITVHIPSVKQQDAAKRETADSAPSESVHGLEEQRAATASTVSVTRSRRIKIHKNKDGSTSQSESQSMATSVTASPHRAIDGASGATTDSEYSAESEQSEHCEREDDAERVLVPKKWFESMLQELRSGHSASCSAHSAMSSPIRSKMANMFDDGMGHIACDRTWFEQLLRGVYSGDNAQSVERPNNDRDAERMGGSNQSIDSTPNPEPMDSPKPMGSGRAVHREQSEKTLSRAMNESASRGTEGNTATNSVRSESPSKEHAASTPDEDAFNFFFKRKQPISVLSEMLSESGDRDADDEYDPAVAPNNLRQSVDSVLTVESEDDETSRFIRESAALLNKTANFFENFSDSEASSMDYRKTDGSREEMDKVLRSSMASDSSQWSLSSLSSMDFDKMPASLAKFDQFLNIGGGAKNGQKLDSKAKTASKFLKTPMATIREMATPSTSALSTDSEFTINSTSDTFIKSNAAHKPSTNRMSASWRDPTATLRTEHRPQPNTPRLFGGGAGSEVVSMDEGNQSNLVDTVDTANQSNTESVPQYHSEDEKAETEDVSAQRAGILSAEDDGAEAIKITATPTTTTTATGSGWNPRFTDGTLNTCPSLPPSHRGATNQKQHKFKGQVAANQNEDQSLLPIQALRFLDIELSASQSSAQSAQSEHSQSEMVRDRDDHCLDSTEEAHSVNQSMSLVELKKFGDSIDADLRNILSVGIGGGGANDSFLRSMGSVSHSQCSSQGIPSNIRDLHSLNVSGIESSATTGSTAKNSESTTSSAFPKTTRFPPLTPQDLLGLRADDREAVHSVDSEISSRREFIDQHSSLDATVRIGADDSDDDGHRHSEDMELEDLKRPKSPESMAPPSSGGGGGGGHSALSFGFNFDSQGTPSQQMQHDVDSSALVVGDLEMVEEEPEESEDARFVGMGSHRETEPRKQDVASSQKK